MTDTTGFVILTPDRKEVAMIVLKARLQMELKVPGFALGQSGRHTMHCVRRWGFTGKTRKQALQWVLEQINE